VEKGAFIGERNEKNQTALHIAVSKGHIDIVIYLIQNGAEIKAIDNEKKIQNMGIHQFIMLAKKVYLMSLSILLNMELI